MIAFDLLLHLTAQVLHMMQFNLWFNYPVSKIAEVPSVGRGPRMLLLIQSWAWGGSGLVHDTCGNPLSMSQQT